MNIFRVVLPGAWLAIVYVTVVAINAEGLMASITVFSDDLAAGNWRTQFNLDLLVHLALVGIWVAWRQKFSIAGIVVGLLCTFSGTLFSAIYLFGLMLYHKGDVRAVLLGKHSETQVA